MVKTSKTIPKKLHDGDGFIWNGSEFIHVCPSMEAIAVCNVLKVCKRLTDDNAAYKMMQKDYYLNGKAAVLDIKALEHSNAILVRALEQYLQAGHKEARRLASIDAKEAIAHNKTLRNKPCKR